jgi:glycosyltransferase involved in cell wall biosynthesis
MDYSTLFTEAEATQSDLMLKMGNLINKPVYSIFIPTFNRPDLLKEAIESALNQDYNGDYEIIVIDNCSENKNFKIVEEYISKLSLKHNKCISLFRCLKMSNGWNMGIVKSSADWVIMLHDDDLLKGNHLSEVDRVICKVKNIGALCSDSENLIQTDLLSSKTLFFIFLKEAIKSIRRNRLIKLKILDFYFHNPSSNTGIVLNRKIALEKGGFNNKLYGIPDYALFFRIVKDFNNVYYLNKKLSIIRFANNYGLNREVIYGLKKSSEQIRIEIQNLIPYFKINDFGFHKLTSQLTDLEYDLEGKSFQQRAKISCLRIYTRTLTLLVFIKSIIF